MNANANAHGRLDAWEPAAPRGKLQPHRQQQDPDRQVNERRMKAADE